MTRQLIFMHLAVAMLILTALLGGSIAQAKVARRPITVLAFLLGCAAGATVQFMAVAFK